MNAARTSVEMTAVTSRMRRRRFHRFRWGSKNICLSSMDGLFYSTCAKTAATIYPIQYESYGRGYGESMDGPEPEESGPDFWPDVAGGAGAGSRCGVARVDAEGVSAGIRGHADLWGTGQEPAAAWAVCDHRRKRRIASDADPAAWVSAVSCAVFPAVWHGELRRGGVCADCAGAGRVPVAGGVCAADSVLEGQGWGRHVHAVAGGAVPLYGGVCCGSADGD